MLPKAAQFRSLQTESSPAADPRQRSFFRDTRHSPIAGGKAISVARKPSSPEEKQHKQRKIFDRANTQITQSSVEQRSGGGNRIPLSIDEQKRS